MSAFQPHPILSSRFSTLKVLQTPENPHLVIVELCNPKKQNAISSIMWKEIGRLFHVLGRLGDDCRVVILKGNGPVAFTTGIDLSDHSLFPNKDNNDDDDDAARRGIAFGPQIRDMQDCFTAIELCPIPVIAAIEGYCIGAGVDLACVCDIRLCSPTALFSIREVQIGLAADIGTLQRLPKITANDSRVRELCYTGDFFDSHEAWRIGFVSRITDRLMTDVMELAQKIAANSPIAIVGTKKSLVYSRDHSVAEGLEHIATHNTLALMTNDIPMAVLAAKQKKRPIFRSIPKFSKL